MEGLYYKRILCPEGMFLPKKTLPSGETDVSLAEFITSTLGDVKAARLIIAISIAIKAISANLRNKAKLGMQFLGFESNPNKPSNEEIANEIFFQMIKDTGVVWQVGCATHSKPDTFPEFTEAEYVVNFSAQDGVKEFPATGCSSSVFAIFTKNPDPGVEDQTLQPGKNILYSGYALYGHSTVFYVSLLKNRVDGFVLDTLTGDLILMHENIKTPTSSPFYTMDEGISFYYSQKILNWLEEKKNRKDEIGARGRYSRSKVADIHRILKNGGIYCHPQSKFMNHICPHRLVYECQPLAHLITQSGGLATDGKSWLLDIVPTHLHCTTTFFIGSAEEVILLMKHLNPVVPEDKKDSGEKKK